MSVNKSTKSIHKKQLLIAVTGLVLVVGVMVLGMWISDPNKNKPTSLEEKSAKAKELLKDFTARSSNVVSPEDRWIEMSEQRMQGLTDDNRRLRREMEDLKKDFLANGALSDELAKHDTNVVPEIYPNPIDKSFGVAAGLMDAVIDKGKLPPPPNPQSTAVNYSESRSANLIPSKSNSSSIAGALVPTPPLALAPPRPNVALNTSLNSAPALGPNGLPQASIMVVSLSNAKENEAPFNKATQYLPAGSFATAILLAGVDAPTGAQATTNPIPVLFRIKDAGQLPNFHNSDVSDCHVLGAAYGDISSERAYIRLESISCILTNGDVLESQVSGYVTGEDGKAGMRGALVSKQGALIAKSLVAGIASGVGSSILSQSQDVSTSALGTVTSIDPDKALQAGLAKGSSSALERIADYYIARASETYPIIEIDAYRISEIVFTAGVDLGTDIIGQTRDR